MKKTHVTLSIMWLALLAGCTTTSRNAAPVVERSPGLNKADAAKTAQASKPVSKPVADSNGYYTVKKGDTLLRIALDFGQNYRDLIAWNNLVNPNDIKVDQVLRVLPPEPGTQGAQTASVVPPPSLENKPPAQPVQASVPHKSSPRGDKRVYSDATLAEMQRPEASASATASAAASTSVASSKPEVKPTETRAPEPAAGNDEDGLSWTWPADGKVVASFGDNRQGIDIAGQPGQQVLAAGAGKVMYAGNGIRGYGNLIIVRHTNSLLSAYAHNKTILVKEGQTVSKGQKIAEMGNSDSDAVKLHFEIRQQGKPVDPSKFLPSR